MDDSPLPLRWRVPRVHDPRAARVLPILAALAGGGVGALALVLSPGPSLASPLLFAAPLYGAALLWIFGGAYAAGSENEITERLARSNANPFPAALCLSEGEIFWTEVGRVERSPERYLIFPAEGPFGLRPISLDLPLDPALRERVVREVEARIAHARHNP